MNNIQVKFGKPSKFYVNNKIIDLNTAFGMYKKGANFIVNGKKLSLNENSFGITQRKKNKKNKKKRKKKKNKEQQVSNNKTLGHRIPIELVKEIILMARGLNKWEATKRWDGDNYNWSGVGREYIGHPGYNREDVMKLKSDEIMDIMDNLPGPYDDYSGSNSYNTRWRDTKRWSSDYEDWSGKPYSSGSPDGLSNKWMNRAQVMRLSKPSRLEFMRNNFWYG